MTGWPASPGHSVGDLAIGFRNGSPAPSGRSRCVWTNLAADQAWQLWQQPPAAGWKGFPLTEIKAEGWHIWLLGELYGPHVSGKSHEQQLLQIVQGERDASVLNGHLLLWAWEESRKQWHVLTDRFGTLHCYHACHGGGAALGTCSAVVAQLASRRQLDWTALTGFLGFGFFPQDRTFYQDLRILRPATHYVFSAGGAEISAKRYWEWRHSPEQKRSYEDTVEAFGNIFEQVMGGMLRNGRVAIPISGGLDSRSTVAAFKSGTPEANSKMENGRFWSYSYGYSDDSVETRISRQVAAARGLPFTAFTIQPYLFDYLDQILGAVEGFQDITQCRQAFVADELGQNADFVVAAHWGDVWLDDMGLVDEDRGQLSDERIVQHTFKKMAKRGRAWLLENLCAPQLGNEAPEGLLPRFIKAGLGRLQHIEDPDFRVKAFKTDNWSFRWTLPSIRMFQAAAFPRLPFYDTRLTDFFGTVPSAFVSGRKLQIDYLKRFAPDLARVEWQATGVNLYHGHKKESLELPKRAMKKALRLITGKKIIERNWEVQFAAEHGQAGLEHWLLRPGLRLHDLVSREKIKTLLKNFRAEPLREGRGYTVSMLLTFSSWLERQG